MVIAQECGFSIPSSCISNNCQQLRDFLSNHPHTVIKNINTPGIEYGGYRQVYITHRINDKFLKSLTQTSQLNQIIYLQEEIKREYELRITVIGKKVFASKMTSLRKRETAIDWRTIEMSKRKYEAIDLSPQIERSCIKLCQAFGLEFGAIDLVKAHNGTYYFLEINPCGQYLWLEKKTGIPLSQAMADLLANPTKNSIENY